MLFPKIIWPFVFSLLATSTAVAQSKDEQIKAIRREFQAINHDSSLQKLIIDDPEQFLGQATDGGGELTGYFKKDSIHKITVMVGLSFGWVSGEYYFKSGKLIFVYETQKTFGLTDSAGINYNKLDLAFEGRYYFVNEKLISKIEKGSRMSNDDKNVSQRILSDAKHYATLLKAKRKQSPPKR